MNRKWTSILTLGVVAALVAGPAWGQTTPSTPSDAGKSTPAKPEGKAESKSDGMKSDTMKSETKAGRSMARGGNREQVKAAQQALKDKGHDPGTIDGVMGSKTQAALKAFQKAEGLKESGRLDSETMAKLGVEAKTSGTSTSPAASPPTGSDKSSPTGPTGAPSEKAPGASSQGAGSEAPKSKGQ